MFTNLASTTDTCGDIFKFYTDGTNLQCGKSTVAGHTSRKQFSMVEKALVSFHILLKRR
jgi:hypothetical protein